MVWLETNFIKAILPVPRIARFYKDCGKVEVPAARIGSIKVKRSFGHTLLISASTGAVLVGMIGAASGESKVNDGTISAFYNALTIIPAEGFAQGMIIGEVLDTATIQ